MNKESFEQFKLLHNVLEQQIILLRDAYRKIYLKSSNPKYKEFSVECYFDSISYVGSNWVEVTFIRGPFVCPSLEDTFTYAINLDEITMSKEEIEAFAKSEIEAFDKEKFDTQFKG